MGGIVLSSSISMHEAVKKIEVSGNKVEDKWGKRKLYCLENNDKVWWKEGGDKGGKRKCTA